MVPERIRQGLPSSRRRKRRPPQQRQQLPQHWMILALCVLLTSSPLLGVSAKTLRAASPATHNNTTDAYASYAATRRNTKKVLGGRHERRPKRSAARKMRPKKVPRDLQYAETRIVGGSPVDSLDKHPFFAEWHNQFCGGALIHDDLVLTAAHCYTGDVLTPDIYFRNLRRAQAGSVKRQILDTAAHPKFNAKISIRNYDYLLLKLDSSALVDEASFGNPTGVETIELNTDYRIPAASDELWGIGYGQVGENVAGMSPVLRDVSIEAFSNQTCRGQYGRFYDKEYMFCAGDATGGSDTCQGDSGGPIVHQETGKLVGIVSFGIGCARHDFAGVNSRVSAVADWLEDAKCRYSNYPLCDGSRAPTPAPVGPSTVAGSGSITVTIVLDDYPAETAWTFSAQTGDETLHLQSYDSPLAPRETISKTFDNLAESENYMFKISDKEGDGICCTFGDGEITITDNVQGVDVWTTRGNYGKYYEVDLKILPTSGHAQVVGRSGQYKPSSWLALEQMTAPDNVPGWPGALPSADSFSVVVNVETDDYPEENSWELLHENPDTGEWTLIGNWDGAGAGLRNLESTEFNNLARGWYRFVVRDSEQDGNCCDYGTGYVSLTGPLAMSQGQKGLIWGNDGKFWAMDEIYFEIENSGFVSHISFQSS